MNVCEAKQGTMENGLSEWLCHTQKNNTAVGGQMMTVKALKMELILKASEMDGGSGSKTQHYMEISGQRRCLNRCRCGKEVARMCDTNHCSVHNKGYF